MLQLTHATPPYFASRLMSCSARQQCTRLTSRRLVIQRPSVTTRSRRGHDSTGPRILSRVHVLQSIFFACAVCTEGCSAAIQLKTVEGSCDETCQAGPYQLHINSVTVAIPRAGLRSVPTRHGNEVPPGRTEQPMYCHTNSIRGQAKCMTSKPLYRVQVQVCFTSVISAAVTKRRPRSGPGRNRYPVGVSLLRTTTVEDGELHCEDGTTITGFCPALPAREYRKAGPCGASGCQDAGSWHLAGEFRGTR
jgi:hypothetical protein